MKHLLLCCLIMSSTILWAQKTIEVAPLPSEEEQVIKVIDKLFDSMRAGDGKALKGLFREDATMKTVRKIDNKLSILEGNVEDFVKVVSEPHDKVFDEKIWSYDVRIDGALATVWTDYTFFLGDEMRHCGINTFQLIKGRKGWQIMDITDTRRKEKCITESDPEKEVNEFVDAWHKAAATADGTTFFRSMDKDCIYIGTDASERWERDEMQKWAKPYFQKDSAWDFTATKRDVYFSDDGVYAWFEESLDTWMGVCRGSGVLKKTKNGWKFKHYHLSVTVPNDVVKDFISLVSKYEEGKK